MLDLDTLRRIKLNRYPPGQIVVARAFLAPNYSRLPGVSIQFEGLENLPDEPVLFAMNHTDRYNYWPFQYKHWRLHDRFTATWVKGKYYENRWVGRFMEWTNNIPAASRGYLITKDFDATLGRRPNETEYTALRTWVDSVAHRAVDPDGVLAQPDDKKVPSLLLEKRRNILGRDFDPSRESYAECIDALFREMTRIFVRHNRDALDMGLDLLVFPQGTRSIRLSRGRIGLSQVALRYKVPVIPVGCSGSDQVYPSSSPWGKRGNITYRLGKPIRYEDVPDLHITESYEPFTPEAEEKHRPVFQAHVDLIMDRIDELVDAPYRFDRELQSDGVSGSNRFI